MASSCSATPVVRPGSPTTRTSGRCGRSWRQASRPRLLSSAWQEAAESVRRGDARRGAALQHPRYAAPREGGSVKFKLAILAGGTVGALLTACVAPSRPFVTPTPSTFALTVHVFDGDPARDEKIPHAKVSTGNGDPLETDGAGNA